MACIYIKNVEPALSLVPRSKGSGIALVVETSNAESPTMMNIELPPQFAIVANSQ